MNSTTGISHLQKIITVRTVGSVRTADVPKTNTQELLLVSTLPLLKKYWPITSWLQQIMRKKLYQNQIPGHPNSDLNQSKLTKKAGKVLV